MPRRRRNPLADDLNPKTYADMARGADAILRAYRQVCKTHNYLECREIPQLSDGRRFDGVHARYILSLHADPMPGTRPLTQSDIMLLRHYAGALTKLEDKKVALEELLARLLTAAEENGVSLDHLHCAKSMMPFPYDVARHVVNRVEADRTDVDYFSSQMPETANPRRRKNPAKVPEGLNPRTGRQLVEAGLWLYEHSDKLAMQAMNMRIDVRPNREHPNETLILRGHEIPGAVRGDGSKYTADEMARIKNAAKKYEYCTARARVYEDMFAHVAELAKQNGVVFDPSLPAQAEAEGVPLFQRILYGDGPTSRRNLVVL